jgi:ABC-type uncharacterized transport system fused permease/ATPase subunit
MSSGTIFTPASSGLKLRHCWSGVRLRDAGLMASAQLDLQSIEFSHQGMTTPLFTDLTVQFPFGWTGIVGPNGAGWHLLQRHLARD